MSRLSRDDRPSLLSWLADLDSQPPPPSSRLLARDLLRSPPFLSLNFDRLVRKQLLLDALFLDPISTGIKPSYVDPCTR